MSMITLWNKCDLTDPGTLFKDFDADASVSISAKTGEGIEDFYLVLGEILKRNRVYIDMVIPYRDAAVIAEIRQYGQLLSEEFEADGTHITAYVPASTASKLYK